MGPSSESVNDAGVAPGGVGESSVSVTLVPEESVMVIDDETTTGSANLKVIASPLVRVPLRSESATDTAWRSAPLPAGSGTINPTDSSTASHLMVNEAICALVTGLLGRYVRAVPTWAMPAAPLRRLLSSCHLQSPPGKGAADVGRSEEGR